MKKMNPFLTSGYLGPQYFCDREKETEKLLSSVQNGRNATLMAPRRYGKTGLIKNVFNALPSPVVGIYLDVYSTEDLASFVKLFAREVVSALETTPEKVLRTLGEFFRSLRPTVTPQGDGTVKWSFDVTPTTAPASLKETFAYLAACKRDVVVAIDEFQQVREYPEHGVEALMRSYIQFLPNVHFIFAGSRQHMMSDMFVSPRGPFYNSTDIVSLMPIDRGRYFEFASRFFAEAGLGCDEAAFDALYARFDGITWYVQAVLNRIWAEGGGLLSAGDVDSAIAALVEDRDFVFRDLFASQTEVSGRLLRAIAREGVVTAPTGKAFLSQHGLGAASTVASALEKLVESELVYAEQGTYRVYDRLFGVWLCK